MKYCEGCLEKQIKIEQLQDENRLLKVKLRYHERKQQEGYFGISTPSSKAPFKSNADEEKTNRKGGARAGHAGHGRNSYSEETADKVITIEGDNLCPYCGEFLEFKEARQRTVMESEPLRPQKVLYKLHHKFCKRCGKGIRPKVSTVLPRSLFGNQLAAQAATMHYYYGVPMGRISGMTGILSGSLVNMFHRMAGYFAPALEALKEHYRQSEVKHADETGWRNDGQNGYAWLFCTAKVSLFCFEHTRSAEVPMKVFGPDEICGVLVVDRYSAYNRIRIRIQYCYAHLLREVQNLQKDFPDSLEVTSFVRVLAPLLAEAMKLRAQPITDRQYYRRAKKLKRRIIETNKSPAHHLGIRAIQDIFIQKEYRLYHWVDDRCVPPDNNLAERDLRPTVIARKVSFGSSSDAGAHTRSILMSVLHTINKCKGNLSLESILKNILDKIASYPNTDIASLFHQILHST